ncbi:MAG: DoxX family protein [Balneolaceae bacterium]
MDTFLSKGGRFLYALPFGIFGLFHFMMASDMAMMVPLPGGVFWVYLTGVALLAACVSFIIEKQVRLAGLLLGIMLLIFVVSVHVPGAMGEDQMASQNAMMAALKDLALAGGAFFIASTYSDSSASSNE